MIASFSNNKGEIVEVCNYIFRRLDDLSNIGNPYFDDMVNRFHPPELRLNKANASDSKAPFWIIIYLLQTELFLPNFMTLILTY